jgi:hypothetical protein
MKTLLASTLFVTVALAGLVLTGGPAEGQVQPKPQPTVKPKDPLPPLATFDCFWTDNKVIITNTNGGFVSKTHDVTAVIFGPEQKGVVGVCGSKLQGKGTKAVQAYTPPATDVEPAIYTCTASAAQTTVACKPF